MYNFRHKANHRRIGHVVVGAVVGLLLTNPIADGDAQDRTGWRLERAAKGPTYAFTHPATTNIDIDTVVLTCSEVEQSTVLQLELYPSGSLPLIPSGASAKDLRESPHLQLLVDGRSYPVSMHFADDHILVADAAIGEMPVVSRALVDAMANGHTMNLRFQLVATHSAGESTYDGEATIELQAGRGGAVLGAVRDCRPEDDDRALPRAE